MGYPRTGLEHGGKLGSLGIEFRGVGWRRERVIWDEGYQEGLGEGKQLGKQVFSPEDHFPLNFLWEKKFPKWRVWSRVWGMGWGDCQLRPGPCSASTGLEPWASHTTAVKGIRPTSARRQGI